VTNTSSAGSADQYQTEVRSSRDKEVFRARLEQALAEHLPGAIDHRVGDLSGTSATGMSSETLLFEATWEEDGEVRSERLVARVAPESHDVPVFPEYDMAGQFRTIQTVAALTDVPVPPQWWCEPDPSIVGSPFFVMGRVDGEVPPDIPPYNIGPNWLFDASPVDQARLQESSIGILARLHAIEEPERRFPHLVSPFPGDTPLRRHVAGRRHWYEWAAKDSGRSEVVEKGFAWLEGHWPAHESPAVFNWGDSRIGNVMYRNFEPVAVLDWEMAGIGPPELEVGWMVYLHGMFEDMTSRYGLPGLPHFMRPDDAAATYERLSGRRLQDLDWFITYSCLQLAIVFLRTGQRAVRFGERPPAANADELLLNAPYLAALVARP
jgi:aminoglycoside phosphotransferase (APT) family kinase protein